MKDMTLDKSEITVDMQETVIPLEEGANTLVKAGIAPIRMPDRSGLPAKISQSLAQASIAAANEKYVTGGRGGLGSREGNKQFKVVIRTIFFVFFVVPVVALSIYLLFISADQYEVETRFAVRSVSTPMGDIISSIGGSSAASSKTESSIIAKYLQSEGMARNLDQEIDIRHLYSNAGDFLTRFDPSKSIEALAGYWRWKIGVSEESATGLITVKVAAFSPQDAVTISQAVLNRATILVNSLSEQNKRSILDVAQRRLERARQRLSDISGQMVRLRNQSGVLDSDVQSAAQARLVAALDLELAKLEANRASLAKLSSDAVRIKAIEPQITSLRKQIDIERAKMTGNGPGGKSLSGIMNGFEKLKVDEDVARKEFAAAATAYEDSRVGAERQEIYLSVFMKPETPESSTYPKRFLVWIAGFAIAAATTFALIAAARLIRDNRAA